MAPVGSLSFTVPPSRATTSPVTVMTLSARSASALSKTAEPEGMTHCVRP
jgi:hypothetical protein